MTLLDKAHSLWDNSPELVIGGAVVALVLAFLAVVVPASIREHDAWETNCKEVLGGRVVDHTAYGNATNPKDGSVSITSSTTYYCLSPSGGILDIR